MFKFFCLSICGNPHFFDCLRNPAFVANMQASRCFASTLTISLLTKKWTMSRWPCRALHLLCEFQREAAEPVIAKFLEAHPAAAAHADKDGYMPLPKSTASSSKLWQ